MGFLVAQRKLNWPPLMGCKELLFNLQESIEMSRPINVCSLIQPFLPLHCMGMYQNIFAYYSTTRANRKIWVNGSFFDDWYNLYEFCTSRVSNWNLHARLHTYKLISLEAQDSAEQVFFIDSYFVSEMRVPTDD